MIEDPVKMKVKMTGSGDYDLLFEECTANVPCQTPVKLLSFSIPDNAFLLSLT